MEHLPVLHRRRPERLRVRRDGGRGPLGRVAGLVDLLLVVADVEAPLLCHAHHEEDVGVLDDGYEDEDDAGQDPHLDGVDGVGRGGGGEHGVGDVHQHQERGDDQGDAA